MVKIFEHKQQGERSNTIQIIRALCIIAVVMIHTSPNGEWQAYIRPFINYCVATFIFLSGYLTKDSYDDWFSFMKKRIVRVLVPYFIWSVIYSLPRVYNEGISVLFINLITTRACFPFYYIAVYIQFVLLTPLLIKLAKSKYQALGWLVAPISILIFRYYGIYLEPEFNSNIQFFSTISCLCWFSFYYLGLLLGNRIIDVKLSFKTLICVYVVCIVLQIAEGYYWFLDGESECGSQLKISSLLTSSAFALCVHAMLKEDKIHISNGFLRSIGDYSFGIYLCHVMVMMVLRFVPGYEILPFGINSAVVLLLSLLCCFLGYKILGAKMAKYLGLR